MGQHYIIKEAGESIGQLLLSVFKEIGYRRVHLIVAAPKSDAVEGKLPGLCIYLYNLTVDEPGISGNQGGRRLETIVDENGKSREVMREMPLSIRLDYLVTTWAQTPEEEQLLMGIAIKGLLENPMLKGKQLHGESFDADEELPVYLSQKLDEGVLSRFWASINQPMKPAIQVWTTVPIYPSGGAQVRRVEEKDVRFFDLNKMKRGRR